MVCAEVRRFVNFVFCYGLTKSKQQHRHGLLRTYRDILLVFYVSNFSIMMGTVLALGTLYRNGLSFTQI